LDETARELRARTYPELGVDVLEMALHGLGGHEECGRDVLVGVAVSDELGDAKLAWRQRRSRRLPPADARDLSLRPLRPEHGAEFIESGERCLERLACRPLLLRTSAHLPQDQQRPGALERHLDAVVLCQSLLESLERTLEILPGTCD